MTKTKKSKLRKCNSEYSHTLIKNCRKGVHIGDVMYCACPEKCESCVLVQGRYEIPMHPKLYEKWKQKEAERLAEKGEKKVKA